MDLCADLMDRNGFSEESCIVLAESQTNGRGRRGRSWKSDVGNLYLSLGFECPNEKDISQLSFVAALAAGKSIASFNKDMKLAYKWPNDLFVEDKKIGGILIETKDQKVIIGFGLNILTAPFLVGYDATSMKDQGVEITPEDFIETFIPNFDLYKAQWMQEGFENIRNEWTSWAWKLNDYINVKDGQGRVFKGFFKGIDSKGGLIIQHADKEEVLYSAQIVR